MGQCDTVSQNATFRLGQDGLGQTDPTMVVLFFLLLLALLIQSSTQGDLALRQDHLGQDDRGKEGFPHREGDST